MTYIGNVNDHATDDRDGLDDIPFDISGDFYRCPRCKRWVEIGDECPCEGDD